MSSGTRTLHVAPARPPRWTDGWPLFTACILACAAIVALTPAPPSGPAQTARTGGTSAGLTAAGPDLPQAAAAPSVLAAGGRNTGRRLQALRGIAALLVIGLLVWLIDDDVRSIDDRKPDRHWRSEAMTPHEEKD